MSESFDEYRTRVLGYLGDRDPLRVQAATPRRLERMLDGVSRGVLVRRPGPRTWCIAEIRDVPARQRTACYGVHERRGRQTLWEFVVLEAAHDLNHLRQVAAILERPR